MHMVKFRHCYSFGNPKHALMVRVSSGVVSFFFFGLRYCAHITLNQRQEVICKAGKNKIDIWGRIRDGVVKVIY